MARFKVFTQYNKDEDDEKQTPSQRASSQLKENKQRDLVVFSKLSDFTPSTQEERDTFDNRFAKPPEPEKQKQKNIFQKAGDLVGNLFSKKKEQTEGSKRVGESISQTKSAVAGLDTSQISPLQDSVVGSASLTPKANKTLTDRTTTLKDKISSVVEGIVGATTSSDEFVGKLQQEQQAEELKQKDYSALRRFVQGSGVFTANILAISADFAGDFVLRNLGRKIEFDQPLLKSAYYLARGESLSNDWKKFFDTYVEDKTQTQQLFNITEQLTNAPAVQPTKEWAATTTAEKFSPQHLPETVLQLGIGVLPSVGIIAASAATGGTAGLVFGTSILGAATAGQVESDALEYGVDRDRAQLLGLATGVASAALEYIVPSRLFAGGDTVKRNFISAFTRRLAGAAISETGTEVTQESIVLAAEKTFRDDLGWGEVATRTIMAGASGFLGGAGMAMLSGVVNKTMKADILDIDTQTQLATDMDGQALLSELNQAQQDGDFQKATEITDQIRQQTQAARESQATQQATTETQQTTEVPAVQVQSGLPKAFQAKINRETPKIKELEESIKRGDTLPPIPVYEEGGNYFTNKDGDNRLIAYQNVGVESIPVNIQEKTTLTGTQKQAQERAKAPQPPTVKEGEAAKKQSDSTEVSKKLSEYYTQQDQEAVGQAWYEVMAQMEIAQAGQRIWQDGEVVGGVASTFPDFIPPELRIKTLFDSVLSGMVDPANLTYPPDSQPRKQALFEQILAEIDATASTDGGSLLVEIKEQNEKSQATKQKASASTDRSTQRSKAAAKKKIKDADIEKYIDQRGTVKFRTPSAQKDLVTIHNLNASGVIKANRMGGLPVPSIAITKADVGLETFGEISLVGGSEFASEDIFMADVYSKRVPREKFEVDQASVYPLINEAKEYGVLMGHEYDFFYSELSDVNNLTLKALKEKAVRSDIAKAMYLDQELGIKLTPIYKENRPSSDTDTTRSLIKNDEVYKLNLGTQDFNDKTEAYFEAKKIVEKIVDEQVEQTAGAGLPKGLAKSLKEAYTEKYFMEDGDLAFGPVARLYIELRESKESPQIVNREAMSEQLAKHNKKFTNKDIEAWVEKKYSSIFGKSFFYNDRGTKKQYTLDNIMNYMLGRVRGKEAFFYGSGTLRSLITKKISGLDQLKAKQDLLQSEESNKKIHDQLSKDFNDLLDTISSGPGVTYDFQGVAQELGTVGASFSKSKIKGVLQNKIGYKNAPDDLVTEIYEFLNRLRSAPVSYFELKPQRVVNLSEFKGAIVPSDVDSGVVNILEKNGLHVVKYDAQKEDKKLKIEDIEKYLNERGEDLKFRQSQFSEAFFTGTEDLTLKTIERLQGRETVSRQFISDLTNSADIKQAEKDLIRSVLATMPQGKVDVPLFIDKVKTELLPLDPISSRDGEPRYESVTLPDELRGPIANYEEKVYQSPIKTRAGQVHFDSDVAGEDGYFAHTRIENLPDAEFVALTEGANFGNLPDVPGDTRRVIELQSDLFQKGRLESEFITPGQEKLLKEGRIGEAYPEYNQLEPYRNTWHERLIREEVKQAAVDGKTKLQFPTGETAMKIEGLVNRADKWVTLDNTLIEDGSEFEIGDQVSFRDETGNVHEYRRFIVTKNNRDGTFEAADLLTIENNEAGYEALAQYTDQETGDVNLPKKLPQSFLDKISSLSEQLSAKDTVDTKNPIYKFYEKEVQRYLVRNYDAQQVTDAQGVTWVEVELKTEYATRPIEAFRVKDDVKQFTGQDITNEQEAEIIALNKKIFGDDNVKITLQIMANADALGSSREGMIEILSGQVAPKDTFYHEAVHKYLDVFSTREEQVALFKAGAEKYNTTNLSKVEEMIAEDFITYAKNREGVIGSLKLMFDRFLGRIQTYLGNRNEIDSLYQKILSPKPGPTKITQTDVTRTPQQLARSLEPETTDIPSKDGFSRFQERLEEQLLDINGQKYNWDDTEQTYDKISLEADARKAAELVRDNPEKAMEIAKGFRDPAQNDPVLFDVINAVALQAFEEGNVSLGTRMINKVSLTATRYGQNIVTLRGNFNNNSPQNYIKQVIDARLEKLGNSTMAEVEKLIGKKASAKTKAIAKVDLEVEKLKKRVEKKMKLKQEKIKLAQDIIDSITCA